jgi:tRNA pseudouridine65 synthase
MQSPALPLIYRGERLAVFAKPSGLLVHRGWGNDRVVAVGLAEEALGRRVFPVHRLDRGTSGVLVFALDSEAAASIQGALASGEADKRYWALVRGVPPEEGVIDHPIPRREGGPRVPALTRFRRLFAVEGYALVEANPKTGRLHQVRRHMKHVSHPLIGDVNYGKGDHNRLFRERYGLHRLALHARALTLEADGELRTFRAEVPADLAEPLERLGVPRSVMSSC